MFVLALGSVLVACNKNGARKFDYYVTFDYNVGNLTTNKLEQQYVGVKNGSHITIRPGYSDSFNERTIFGYFIDGWWTAKLDSEGNPIVDENGFVQLDKEWDFSKQTVSENITLYANFQRQYTVKFVDIVTEAESETVLLGKPNARRAEPKSNPPKLSGYTFFGKYYADKERTAEIQWPYVMEKEESVIYVDFIKGENLKFISTASELRSAINSGNGIYLMNDIVFGASDTIWSVGVYNAEFIGNNHTVTITGKNRPLTASKAGGYVNKAGIFGTLGANANIHDVTFVGGSVEYKFGGAVDAGWAVGFFAWRAEEGAKVSNVTVTDAKLTYNTNGLISGAAGIAINYAKAEDIVNLNVDGVTVIKNEIKA